MNITIEDFKSYVAGWLFVNPDDPHNQNLGMGNITAALANALSQIHCDQDGIQAHTKHKREFTARRIKDTKLHDSIA